MWAFDTRSPGEVRTTNASDRTNRCSNPFENKLPHVIRCTLYRLPIERHWTLYTKIPINHTFPMGSFDEDRHHRWHRAWHRRHEHKHWHARPHTHRAQLDIDLENKCQINIHTNTPVSNLPASPAGGTIWMLVSREARCWMSRAKKQRNASQKHDWANNRNISSETRASCFHLPGGNFVALFAPHNETPRGGETKVSKSGNIR